MTTPPTAQAEPGALVRGYLSFSQMSTYSGCGRKYQLLYHENVPSEPSGAAIAGSSIHETIAQAEAQGWWQDPDVEALNACYEEELARRLDEVGIENVRWSGRKTKEFPNGEDLMWWLRQGPVMLKRYAAIRRDDAEAGTTVLPGDVEREVSILMEVPDHEPVLVRGFIDALAMVTADGEPLLRDWKSGTWAEPQQLALYAWMLSRLERPVTVWRGQFGKLRYGDRQRWLQEYDLRRWMPLMPTLMQQALAGIESGLFPMRPSMFCTGCSVREHCAWGQTLNAETV